MNPLLSIITLLATLRADIYNKFNAAMEKAKPLEQFEAGSAARGILNEMDWAQERLKRAGEDLQATLEGAGKFLSSFAPKDGETPVMAATRFLSEFEKNAGESAINEALTAKTVVLHADHENALTAAIDKAKTEAKTEAETEFKAQLAKVELLSTRRADAVTRLGDIAAATLTDDVLAGDDHESAITALEGRISTLKEKNITAADQPKIYADLIASANDEALFTTRLDVILTAAGGSFAAAKPTTTGPKASEKGAAPLAAGNPEKKKLVI